MSAARFLSQKMRRTHAILICCIVLAGGLKTDEAVAGIGYIALRANVKSKLCAMNRGGEYVAVLRPSPDQEEHFIADRCMQPEIVRNRNWRHVHALLRADEAVEGSAPSAS
jgi:hypothetical protein